MTVDRSLPRHRFVPLVGTVLVIGALVAVVRDVGVRSVIEAVLLADWRLLTAALLVYTLSWPVRGHRYHHILSALGRPIGSGFSTWTVFVSQTANLVVPARAGDVGRAYLVKRHRGVPYASGASSLTVERIADLLAISTIGFVALVAVIATSPAGASSTMARVGVGGGGSMIVAGGVGLLGVVSLLAVVTSARDPALARSFVPDRLIRPFESRINTDSIDRFAADLLAVAVDTRSWLTVGAWSLLIWSIDVLAAVFVLVAIDAPGGVIRIAIVVTLAVCVANLAKVLPLTQGGIGLYEAAFAGVVVGLSPIGTGTAIAAALVDHGIKNLVTIIGGGMAMVSIRSRSSTDRSR